VNCLPGKGFREDYQPTSRPQVLRGPSTQVVQILKQRDCEQWFGRLRSNGFGVEFRTTYNYTQQSTFGGYGRAKGEPMSCSLGIYPGGRKAPGIGPGVGSGCLSASSQGVGPGLDQEWGKGGPLRARR
jgi:hypothetical protein